MINTLTNEIYKLLKQNNVKNEDMEQTLININKNLQTLLWEKINIKANVLNMLKDTIFYNFEYLYFNDKKTGKTSLQYYSKKYPYLMNLNKKYINKKYIYHLKKELNNILKVWNNKIYFANLYSDNNFNWIYGKNASSLIIYEKQKETPSKYGYCKSTHLIDKYNDILSSNIVLCSIYRINEYEQYNTLNSLLNLLFNICTKCINNDKGININYV